MSFSTVFAAKGLRVAALFLLTAMASAQEDEVFFNWQEGPTEGKLGNHASIDVPAGYVFLGQADTIKLLEAMENPTSGEELGTLAPASEEENWFIFFEFDEIGYVPDDEKDDLDSGAMMKSMREGQEYGNEERAKRGWAPLEIAGWKAEPNYNASTNNLEWALHLRSEGYDSLNHDIRVLGRRGVMEAGLVCGFEEYDAALPQVQDLLTGFQFNTGEGYAEYKDGDLVAEYGLTALVTGGMAAAAFKMGFFKKFGKIVIAAVVAVGAFIKKLFGGGSKSRA